MLLLVLITLAYINNRKRLSRQTKEHAQLVTDHEILKNRLAQEIENKNNVTIEKTDGFLRFLSDSRNWAFEYIEEVQEAIRTLDEANRNGKDIRVEIEKLVGLLPQEK